MNREEAFIVDILHHAPKVLAPVPDLPVPFYGKLDWEMLTDGYSPAKEVALYKRLHPVLKCLIMSLDKLGNRNPALLSHKRRWAIFSAPQLERERDLEHNRILQSSRKISPASGLTLTATGINFLAARCLDIRFYKGGSISHVCASGNHLLGLAQRAVKEGTDLVLLISINSMASVVRAAYHNRLGIVSRKGVIRPFHKERDGTIMGDGMALALVASKSLVESTGMIPLARITGTGEMADSYHMYGLDPEGEALQKSIEEATAKGSIMPWEIDLVKCHGTGTQQNDAVEAEVLRRLFHQKRPPVTALKPYFGHTVTASAPIELSFLLSSLKNREIPPIPTTSPEEVDPSCSHLNLALERPIPFTGKYILSLAAGFGGFFSSAVLEVWP